LSKAKLNKKEIRRLREKQAYAEAYEVRMLAERIPNQQALDTCLLQCKDPIRRRTLFNFMEPFLKFPNPEFPSEIARSLIIKP
jgi:hypothetical protein